MNFIVTTTINPPTEALLRFSKMRDWTLIVVSDKSTPHEAFKEVNCVYLTPEEQEEQFPTLSHLLGWATVQRRNIGFLKALEMGAEIIATVDDDNVPFESWGTDLLVGKKIPLTSYMPDEVFDPLSQTNYPHLWHRGFPIQLLSERSAEKGHEEIFVDVEASFWNGDPDIDAICRMEHAPNCDFDATLFPFTSPALGPFNSQNTFITRHWLRDYFMFPFVGRMDDIWGSYLLQARGARVVYTAASVEQVRNEHDLTKDFRLEEIGYENTLELTRALYESPENIRKFVGEASYAAYEEYRDLARSFD